MCGPKKPELTHEEQDAAAQDKAYKDALFWGKVPGCLPLCGACSRFGVIGATTTRDTRTKCLAILVVLNLLAVSLNVIGFLGVFEAPMTSVPWASYGVSSLMSLVEFPLSPEFGGSLNKTADYCAGNTPAFTDEFLANLPGLDGKCETCAQVRDFDILETPPTCGVDSTHDFGQYYMNVWGICLDLESHFKSMKTMLHSKDRKACWSWDEFSKASKAVVASKKDGNPLVYAGYQALDQGFSNCQDSATGMKLMLYIGIIMPLLADVILYSLKLVKGEGRTDPHRDWGCKNKFMGMLSPLIPLIMNGAAMSTFQRQCYDDVPDATLGAGYWCTLVGFLVGFPRALVHLMVQSRDLRDAKPSKDKDVEDAVQPGAATEMPQAMKLPVASEATQPPKTPGATDSETGDGL